MNGLGQPVYHGLVTKGRFFCYITKKGRHSQMSAPFPRFLRPFGCKRAEFERTREALVLVDAVAVVTALSSTGVDHQR